MCSIRALWFITVDAREIILSRRFPSVERKVQRAHSALGGSGGYIAVPTNEVFLPRFKPDLQPSNVIDVPDCPWPVVYIQRGDLYCVALPSLDHAYRTPADAPPLIDLPCVTACFALLQDLSNFVLQFAPSYNLEQMAHANTLISMAMPFGSPIDTELSRITAITTVGFGPGTLDQKRPAWKPYLYRGKQLLRLHIIEEIRAVQYDKQSIKDEYHVGGRIECEAALEGMPDITITYSHIQGSKAKMDSISLHSCCSASTDALTTRKLVFSPGLETFALCNYTMTGPMSLPIRGYYQMRMIGPHQVKLLIQLKLTQGVNNSFEYCNVFIPLPNRGRISTYERAPTAGSVSLDPSRKAIWWGLGERITSQNLEVALPATVTFDGVIDPSESEDAFCSNDTGYIEIHFKINEYCASGLTIEPRNISVNPASRVQYQVERSLVSRSYCIWNSYGKARVAAPPPFAPGQSDILLAPTDSSGSSAATSSVKSFGSMSSSSSAYSSSVQY